MAGAGHHCLVRWLARRRLETSADIMAQPAEAIRALIMQANPRWQGGGVRGDHNPQEGDRQVDSLLAMLGIV